MVQSWGTGRADYSNAVEATLEPVIRSYQSLFYQAITANNVAPNVTVTTDIPITSEFVAFPYDFYASSDANSLIRLVVQIVSSTGAVTTILNEREYQKVAVKLNKGFPVQGTLRILLTNFGDATQNMVFFCSGIYTAEKNYLLYSAPANI